MSVLGRPLARLEGREKVTGSARYAFESSPPGVLYAWIVQSTIANGTIREIDSGEALGMPGVRFVMTWQNALALNDAGDAELLVLQSRQISYRGQVVALVLAETLEQAREAAAQVSVTYDSEPADVSLSTTHPRLYAPAYTNAMFATDSVVGDVEAALGAAPVTIDATYSTPAAFNNPMEPHATVAEWHGDDLDLLDATQGTNWARETISAVFGLPPESVRIRSQHVGGGFGSKGPTRPNAVLAAMAARLVGRPVKIAYTRQMMFGLSGYRSPTISHIRLAAEADGRLTAVSHEAFGQVSPIQEFVEQTAVPTRHMYAAPNRLTTHRVVALNLPTPSYMRGPGETPGLYALESGMDELAAALGIDPVELRILNEPAIDPESGEAFSSRNLVGCLRRGAERFGWSARDPRPAVRRDGRWLVGTGVAASIYPADVVPSTARITAYPNGRFELAVNATDIGTGARTVVMQIAADSLGVEASCIDVRIGDTALPAAAPAGASWGTASWGWAIMKAGAALLEALQTTPRIPDSGLSVLSDTAEEVAAMTKMARFAFGAQFVEARVDLESGEVTVPRMLGVFAAGRILNPRTARAQFVGGMTMGLSMALHEDAVVDANAADYANRDFASYHIAAHADVPDIDVEWLDEEDGNITPTGGKGVGEIGMVGTAAAVANAVWHATGIRVRDLPIHPDKLIEQLPSPY
ncbi:xanthine dehydrogenase [Subtercola sp. Z020]|uniref:xanthine dehydrogenase family protein molybdopterin-binding subunit n=1 Tax=Subtercola sp. Z020 TaxID=2080582 RepID=UPI000CE8B492|nr:xanthine dehydrogenase family protein molybdopterin-binding subunit [Subtercola sp. Z020]PPF85641.1 xanthine dehydrogenase [Subtercola sp. Z020]